jgi:hypothetical protein
MPTNDIGSHSWPSDSQEEWPSLITWGKSDRNKDNQRRKRNERYSNHKRSKTTPFADGMILFIENIKGSTINC